MKFAAIASILATAAADEVKGYYTWNWGAGSHGPPGAYAGVAFTGLVSIPKAIAQYTPGAAWCCPVLIGPDGGKPWISIGGGNAAGLFNASTLNAIINDLHLVPESYSGVVFDVEIV